ncbi:MAG: hypothetical protein QW707_05600 [Candidatus Bathyarchaeia archaeon]
MNLGFDLGSMILVYCSIIGGWVAWMILKPKPNAVILERIGENYYLSKGFHNNYYLQYRRATYPIPSTYDYWILLGRGFRLRPRWFRFFYVHNGMLARIEESGEKVEAQPAIDPQTLTQFVRSQTVSQILRGLTTSRTQIILNLVLGLAVGLMLGVLLTGWLGGGG